MPSRLIREGILTSERIDKLDASAEVFYRRLMSKVDDHGLYDARPAILRSSLYPLRVDRVREADISRWIAACEKAGLIALYAHNHVASSSRQIAECEMAGLAANEKPYLQMRDTRWTTRAAPKFPSPPNENGCEQVKSRENRGEHKQTSAHSNHELGDNLLKAGDSVNTYAQIAIENSCKHLKTPVLLDGVGDVYGIPPYPPNPHACKSSPSSDTSFEMFSGWTPSPHLETLAKQAGLVMPSSADFKAVVCEFIAYWLTQKRTRTQHEWDHALVKSLKAEQLHSTKAPNKAPNAGKRRKSVSDNFDRVDYGQGGRL